MKQVININFQGRVVPIETSAYEILKQYIDSLSKHFAAEDGKDEIINDIENRIGELFQERLKDGSVCITDDDVNAIIRSMGRPEDFETEEPGAAQSQQQNAGAQQHTYTPAGPKRLYRDENHKLVGGVCSGVANYFGIDIVVVRIVFLILLLSFGVGFVTYLILWIAVPSSAVTEIGSMRKKMYRDPDDKYIGGVCSGLSHYFGISVWIPRLLFIIPFLTFASRLSHWGRMADFPNIISLGFSPGAMLVYIILWLVLPEANTTAEKLEMKGEKVDMNSIKNSVAAEMRGVQERAQKFGKEAVAVANEKGKAFGSDAGNLAKRGSRSFGDIIIFLIKLFGYFILGCICFALVVALFGFGIAAIGIFPMKDFVVTHGWQNAYAWGTLIFFIITPMVGVITWIIRRLAKIRRGSRMLTFGFITLWILGWVCVSLLGVSLSRDFRTGASMDEQEVVMKNPGINSLEITSLSPGQKFSRNRWYSFDPFDGTDDDTAFIRNVEIHIMRSPNDSFRVTTMKMACGRTKRYADTLASLINFSAVQNDSLLVIDKAIAINKSDKFRNQHVIVNVYVPVGKQIKVNRNIGWSSSVRFEGLESASGNIEFENLEEGWEEGEWYTMTKDGLYTLDGKPADSYKRSHVKVTVNGIEVKDKNGKVHVGTDGIVTEGYDNDNDDNDDDGSYRYNNGVPKTRIDSLEINLNKEKQRYNDSLKKEKEKIDRLLNTDAKNENGGTAYLPGHDPTIFLN